MRLSDFVLTEDFVDASIEDLADSERERQAGRIFSRPERNDRLPSNAELVGGLRLRPIALADIKSLDEKVTYVACAA